MVLIACHLPEGKTFSFISLLFFLSLFSGRQQVEEVRPSASGRQF